MAGEHTFHLEVITPDRQFFVGEAQSLVLPAVDGQMGVEYGHEPAVTAVEPGVLRYQVDGVWNQAAVGAGFAEIKPEETILLVSSAEHPDEIDKARAQAALERAEKRLQDQQSIRTDLVHQLVGTVDNVSNCCAQVISHRIQVDLRVCQLQILKEDAVQVVIIVLPCVSQDTVEIFPALYNHGA